VIALALTSFAALGVVLVLVGANQPELAADLELDLAASALLMSALLAGLGAGVLVAGPLVDRYPRRPIFVGSSLIGGLALLAVAPEMRFATALVCMAALGIGLGGYETLLNTVVIERYRAEATRPLTVVHCGATVGAIIGAPLARFAGELWHWSTSFHATGLLMLALGVWGWIYKFAPPAPRTVGQTSRAITAAIAPLAIVAACYVGIETGVTLFARSYADAALGLPAARGSAAISAFWFGLLAGRLLLLRYRGPIDARLLVGAGLAAGLILALATTLQLAWIELAVGAVGVALGLVFPVMLVLTAERFPAARGTATGIVVGAGSLGGLAIPWLGGLAGDAGGVSLAMGSLALWGLVLAASALRAGR
jgi:fucose permease